MSDIYARLPEILNVPTPVVLEIGAHHGEDTIQIHLCCANPPRFYAFEPDPRNLGKLGEAVESLGVTIIEKAIGATCGRMPWHAASFDTSSSLLPPKEHLTRWPSCTFKQSGDVEVTTLDAFVFGEGLERIDFIWADVQGAQRQLIAGGREALSRTRYLYIEADGYENYDGEPNGAEIARLLGPQWETIAVMEADTLYRNTRL